MKGSIAIDILFINNGFSRFFTWKSCKKLENGNLDLFSFTRYTGMEELKCIAVSWLPSYVP
jgi:hypothetical protein